MSELGNSSYTNGLPYLITHSYDETDRAHSIHYLLPNGRRYKVTIDQSEATEEMKHQIGMAFAEGRTNITPK